MNEKFSHSEVPNYDFIQVINSLALPPEKKEAIIKRVERLEQLHWSKRDIANELELRFHLKIGDKENPNQKHH